uniref:Putative secreted protein n=1 Tax=Rhipicephalus microplus TaxID=6941 RepID=A0A6M2DB89_RHIMP
MFCFSFFFFFAHFTASCLQSVDSTSTVILQKARCKGFASSEFHKRIQYESNIGVTKSNALTNLILFDSFQIGSEAF